MNGCKYFGPPDVRLKLLEGTTFPILPWAVLPEDLEEVEKEQRLSEKNRI